MRHARFSLVCTEELLVILEFCELGSLYNVLRENHPEKFSSAEHIGTGKSRSILTRIQKISVKNINLSTSLSQFTLVW